MTLALNTTTALTAANIKTEPVTIRTGLGNNANQEYELVINGTWAGTVSVLRKVRQIRKGKDNLLTQTGADGQAALTDANLGATADELIGMWVRNDTDGSMGPITDNAATTITATLAGGTDNDWDTGDLGSLWEVIDTFTANTFSVGTCGVDTCQVLAVMSAYTSGTVRVVFYQ
jgi:hypothetical protein